MPVQPCFYVLQKVFRWGPGAYPWQALKNLTDWKTKKLSTLCYIAGVFSLNGFGEKIRIYDVLILFLYFWIPHHSKIKE